MAADRWLLQLAALDGAEDDGPEPDDELEEPDFEPEEPDCVLGPPADEDGVALVVSAFDEEEFAVDPSVDAPAFAGSAFAAAAPSEPSPVDSLGRLSLR